MNVILLALVIFLMPFNANAQYVAQTVSDRIRNDEVAIASDQADIQAKQTDIDSIVNDQTATAVTDSVQAVKDIQDNQQVNAVVVKVSQ